MEQRVFHGNITPADVTQALLAEFNQGNLRAQILGESKNLTVQIATSQFSRSGGQTALAVNIQQIEDGVTVQIGQQQWMGVAASLGQTAIAAIINPLNLLGRLDDIAQDIQNLQLNEKVWEIIAREVRAKGASHQLSERLSRLTCEYCGAANPVGEASCVACGAPLGNMQPSTCAKCGYVLTKGEKFCPNCGQQQ
ncbi:MAG: zinc ribbon domain-containing protein [Anaerolineales bacterium]|nr:zinc ribbon domain-containing protein [Anaerolineales bacterium]